MLKKLTWLHISDIHFCPKTAWRDNSARDALLVYLREIDCKPDLIFCTGDIAFGELRDAPIDGQYQQAQQFFDKLLDVCGLDKERLFVVPGTHDVNRGRINDAAQESWNNWAVNAADHQIKINQRFAGPDKTVSEALKRLDEYSVFVEKYLGHQHDPNGRHCYTRTLDLNGCKIGIAGFNSAWTCSGDEDDRTIWLPAEWQFNAARDGLKDADIRIGLIHHPIDWFNNADQQFAKKRILSNFDFWLHGHIHDAWVMPVQNSCTEIAAGAIGAETENEFGFNIVQLDLRKTRSQVEVHLHTYNKQGWAIKPIPIHAPNAIWKKISLSEHAKRVCGKKGDSKEKKQEPKLSTSRDDHVEPKLMPPQQTEKTITGTGDAGGYQAYIQDLKTQIVEILEANSLLRNKLVKELRLDEASQSVDLLGALLKDCGLSIGTTLANTAIACAEEMVNNHHTQNDLLMLAGCVALSAITEQDYAMIHQQSPNMLIDLNKGSKFEVELWIACLLGSNLYLKQANKARVVEGRDPIEVCSHQLSKDWKPENISAELIRQVWNSIFSENRCRIGEPIDFEISNNEIFLRRQNKKYGQNYYLLELISHIDQQAFNQKHAQQIYEAVRKHLPNLPIVSLNVNDENSLYAFSSKSLGASLSYFLEQMARVALLHNKIAA